MCPASKWEIKVRWDSWHGEFLQQIPVAEFEQFAEVYCYPSMGIHKGNWRELPCHLGVCCTCYMGLLCRLLRPHDGEQKSLPNSRHLQVTRKFVVSDKTKNHQSQFYCSKILKSPGIQEMDPKTYQLALPSTVYSLNHLALPSGDCRQVWMTNHLKLNDFSLETHRLGPILGTKQRVAVSQFAMKAMAHSVRWFNYYIK
jgi:hypothetical protein